MSDVFSEARRAFEVLPSPGTLRHAVGKLAQAGIERDRIRGWVLSISAEYGILNEAGPQIDHIMAAAVCTEPRAAA